MCRRNISLELFAAIPIGEGSRMQVHSHFCFEWVFASIPSECEAIPLLCSFFFCLSRGVLRGMCPLKINKAISLFTFPCHSVLVSESHLCPGTFLECVFANLSKRDAAIPSFSFVSLFVFARSAVTKQSWFLFLCHSGPLCHS